MPLKTFNIAIGSDHAGFTYKEMLKVFLADFPLTDFGPAEAGPVDYPDFAHPVALAVEKGDADFGILICGSGNGIAIAANKHQGIRAAICWENELAALCRKHNNANILCIPSRFVGQDLTQKMVMTFLQTEFEGGRHAHRVNKISC